MIENHINPDNKRKWILSAIVIKFLICIYLFYIKVNPVNTSPIFAFFSGDSHSYFSSIESLLETGNYKPFYRMPGIGFPYYLLRLLFTKTVSFNLLVIFQIVYDALACFFLAHLSFQLTKSKRLFLIVFFLCVSNTYFTVFNIWLTSESICTSSLIFSVYFFYQAITQDKHVKRASLFSGFFMTWAVFSRPIYAPLLIIYGLLFVYYFYKRNKLLLIKLLFIYALPFIVTDFAWVYAGYRYKHKLYFLQHSNYDLSDEENEAYYYGDLRLKLINYIQAFGGDLVWWNPDAEISWFNTNPSIKNKVKQLPGYAFTDSFNEDSLLIIKKNIATIYDSATTPLKRDSIEKATKQTLTRFTNNYKKTKPFHYHVLSRLIILKKFLFQPPTYNLYYKQFKELNIIHKMIKIFYHLMYYIYIFGAFFSFIIIVINKKVYRFLPILCLALYGILIYPFLRFCEFRYIVPVVPFLILLSSYSISSLINLLFKET